MNPIFKTTLVDLDQLRPSMRSLAERNDYWSQPQRVLIEINEGKEIWIHSRLLKWHLVHGLKVTEIYRSFRYKF